MKAIPVLALALGLAYNLALVWIWWEAQARGWAVEVRFNDYTEAVVEGVLFHVTAVALLVLIQQTIWQTRKAGAK